MDLSDRIDICPDENNFYEQKAMTFVYRNKFC